MKKTKDTNKGITLIALVITIIVMLILVAVTITMAVNGGLFDYASSAGTKTNTATEAEQEYVNLETNMSVNQLIDKYTGWTGDNTQNGTEDDTQGGTEDDEVTGGESSGGQGTTTITFTIDGVTYTAEEGMNWKQWIDSSNYDSGEFMYASAVGYVVLGDRCVVDPTTSLPAVNFESPIENGRSYVLNS